MSCFWIICLDFGSHLSLSQCPFIFQCRTFLFLINTTQLFKIVLVWFMNIQFVMFMLHCVYLWQPCILLSCKFCLICFSWFPSYTFCRSFISVSTINTMPSAYVISLRLWPLLMNPDRTSSFHRLASLYRLNNSSLEN